MSKIFIAEAKPISPFGFKSKYSWEELIKYAIQYGDWAGIHTNPLWGGSHKLIGETRKLTDKPIFAKGFHYSDDDLDACFGEGADYALVYGRIPKRLPKGVTLEQIFVEPNSFKQFLEFNALGLPWMAYNIRNPEDGTKRKETIVDAFQHRNGKLCQASLIRNVGDIYPAVDAFIVGEHMPTFGPEYRKTA